MSDEHIREHIDLIAKHEQEFLERRTLAQRVGDAVAGFVGSLKFVGLHVVAVGAWLVVNVGTVAGVRHFDPPPFSLPGTVVSFEALLLGSFIVMRQTRMSRRSDERDHLMLQVLLLTEKEITALLGVERQMAERLGMQGVAKDKHLEKLSQDTSIDDMAQTIQESLPRE
jgi:uncharacterized membrane protein